MRRWSAFSWMVGLLALACPVSGSSPSASNLLVGASTCGKCHPKAYQSWKASRHAQAQATLPADHEGDLRCTQCHGEKTLPSTGVQCESCHGQGLYYASKHVMRDAELSRIVGLVIPSPAQVCSRCHNENTPRIRPFDAQASWGLITHDNENKID